MSENNKARDRWHGAGPKTFHARNYTTDIDRISDALSYVPADDRDKWLKMGMAIKSEVGETGFDVWDAWSQQGNSYAARDARDVWKSIRAGGGVSIGTLFHEAKSCGWRDDGTYHQPTPEEIEQRKRDAAERNANEQAEIECERAETATKAVAIWKAATEAKPDHPYLSRKHISPVSTLKEIDVDKATAILGYIPKSKGEPLHGRLIAVPVKQGDGLSTLELIDENGRKAALAGRGSKLGGYWATQSLPDAADTLLIGEGMATVLSASLTTEHPGIAALSSNNLSVVATIMRGRYPDAEIVLLADLVKATGEPDTHAVEAALSVDGLLAIPDFGTDRDPDMKDFNDMAVICGLDAVKRALANATKPVGGEHLPDGENAPAGIYARSVSLIRASDLTPEPVNWLWDGWLAAGKFHVLAGAPGTGKTTISMALAATVTIGGRWPDGTRSITGNVVIWSGEDDPADTLIPRLAKSGADLDRVYFIDGVREGNEKRSFDPAKDFEPLQRQLAEIGGVKLLLVDPVVSAVAGDSHKNAEVRRSLQPLVDLAEAMDCALLGITHFSKGTGGREPVERLTGSLAFGALARVVHVAAKHQEQGEDGRTVRLFCRAKSNIGPDDGGFEYDLHQAELDTHPGIFASSVQWGNAVEGAARELLAAADATDDDGEGIALSSVTRFLSDLLSDGSMRASDVFRDAEGAGYSKRSIQRAADKLKVIRQKEGMKGGWIWTLPKVTDLPEDAEDSRKNYLAPLASSASSTLVEVEI
jgi:putative DNA primase/helicase